MNQSRMLTRFVRETDIDLVMCAGRFTLLEQGALHDLLPAAEQQGVAVVIAGVYNSGLLARDRPPANATYNYQQAPADLLDRAVRIGRICESFGVTLPEAALAYVRRHTAVTCTVVGMGTVAQVNESVRRANVDVPADLWLALRSAGLVSTDAIPFS
jgi:D-threo-aldose 1-dehydrogenase